MIFIIIFICFYLLNFGNNKSTILEVNSKVKAIEENIKKNNYNYLFMKYSPIAESTPHLFTFYYENGNGEPILRMVKISITHEIWWNDFFYFFDSNGRLLKFLKQTLHRPDNPVARH